MLSPWDHIPPCFISHAQLKTSLVLSAAESVSVCLSNSICRYCFLIIYLLFSVCSGNRFLLMPVIDFPRGNKHRCVFSITILLISLAHISFSQVKKKNFFLIKVTLIFRICWCVLVYYNNVTFVEKHFFMVMDYNIYVLDG